MCERYRFTTYGLLQEAKGPSDLDSLKQSNSCEVLAPNSEFF